MADYEASVRAAGGEPVVLDWSTMPVADALAAVDGILLTGGPDVDPARYDETAHPRVSFADPARDDFELELSARALEQDVPLLAICRGMQVLNVAAGGTLVQDIPSEVPGAGNHAVAEPRNATAHPIAIAPGSRLASILGRTIAQVNSRHHQAVSRTAPGLIATATAPDGIVEAVEKPDAPFCVGVEWHPENFVEGGEFAGLFRGLVIAAQERNRTQG